MAGVEINWNALATPDIGGAFTAGLQNGQRSRAMSQFDINNPDSVNALLRVDPRAGSQMLQVGQQQREYQRREQASALLPKAMAGDREAIDGLAGLDPEMFMKMDERQRAQVKAQNDELGTAIAWADTPEKWDQAVEYFAAKGLDVAKYRGRFDMREKVAMETGQLAKLISQAEEYTLAPGSARYRGNSKIAEQPFAPQYRSIGPEQSLVEIPGGGGMQGGDPFAALIQQESGGQQFGPNGQPLMSPKGATGIAQVMPATGPEAARYAGLPWDEQRFRTDPQYNEALGRAYHAVQLAQFGGDETAAAAAYNAGPGRVRQEMQRGGDWQSRLPAETRDYIAKVAPGFGGGARVIAQGAPKQGYQMLSPQEAQSMGLDATTRYQRGPNGQITAVGGQERAGAGRKAETDLRSKFDALPEVKDFKDVRANFQQVQALGLKKGATAQDDIALVFSYMKMLDPGSVVREGEFATAAKAAGVEDRVVNIIQRAESGRILNDDQRAKMVAAAATVYKQRRNTYNSVAEQYRGYAEDYGVKADNVARRYLPTGENPLRPKSAPVDPSAFKIIARRPK